MLRTWDDVRWAILNNKALTPYRREGWQVLSSEPSNYLEWQEQLGTFPLNKGKL